MNRYAKVTTLLGLVGAAVVLAALSAQEKKDELPPDLARVPSNSVLFTTVRFADQWQSDALKPLREKLAKEAPDFLQDIEKNMGLPPEEIERLTLVLQDAGVGAGPLTLIGTAKPYDKQKVLTRIGKTKETKVGGEMVHATEKEWAFWFFSDRAFAFGPMAEVRTLIGNEAKKEGVMTPALQLAAGKRHFVLGVNGEGFAKALEGGGPPVPDQFKPLLKATLLTATGDMTNEGLSAEARLTFGGDADAKAGEAAAKELLDLARGAIPPTVERMAKDKNAPKLMLELLKRTEAGLKEAKLSVKGSAVELTGGLKIDPKDLTQAVVDTVQEIRGSAGRLQSANNLKQMAIAMHNYESTFGNMPPAATVNKDGKPLLSWRVLILPYIEQDALYKEFKLEEPWDSEHNKKLLAKMPKVYAAPGAKPGTTDTPYQAFVGKGTAFEGRKGPKFSQIADGTSNTVMFVEAANPVPWTKPEDVEFDNNKIMPRLGGLFPTGLNAAFFDGSVRFVPKTLDEDILRKLITPSGGEVIPNF